MIFGLTWWYTQNYQELVVRYPALNDFSTMILCVVLTIIPGLLIFVKAFWDYLVAFGALNSMTDGYLNTGRGTIFVLITVLLLEKHFLL